jgi:hypothetical protein
MADAVDAAKTLGVDVQQLARAGALVAHDRLGRLQAGQPAQAQPAHVASNRRQAQTRLPRDAPQRYTLAATPFELLHLLGCASSWTAQRTRTAIQQPGRTFGLEPSQPLVSRAAAHAYGLSRRSNGPPFLEHPVDQQGSTCTRQSSMLMAVHPSFLS